jgi:hypothetical protein
LEVRSQKPEAGSKKLAVGKRQLAKNMINEKNSNVNGTNFGLRTSDIFETKVK